MEGYSTFSIINPKSNMKGFLIFIFALIVLGATAVVAALTPDGRQDPIEDDQKQVFTPFESLSPHTLVYGFWTNENNSQIKAFNMKTGQVSVLASLPSNIKRVRIISPDQMMYIGNTNNRDHGSNISIYSISSKSDSVIVTADTEYGIDEFVVSPNGKYIAIWEVAISDNSPQLLGGKSRVYTVDTSRPGQKNLIYDEDANTPVHYPLAITDSGQLITDKFLPNGTVEYGYGISISDFTGNSKEDVQDLQNGVISTQPVLSPNGKYLAYSAYDGSGGSNVSGDFRTAIVTPNSVEIFDIALKSRKKIDIFSSNNRYPALTWDRTTGKLLVSVVSASPEESGQFEYDLVTNQKREIALGVGDSQRSIVSLLSEGKVLVAHREDSTSALGNLGDSYSPPFSGFSVIDQSNVIGLPLPITEGLVQPIGIFQDSYFQGIPVASAQSSASENAAKTKETLQLQTFTLKPSLAPKREEQQSQPRCRTLAAEICNNMLGTNFSGEERSSTSDPVYNQCFNEQFRSKDNRASCYDSPLYLYGKEGDSIDVYIALETYNTDPQSDGKYSVTIGQDGEMIIDGNIYERIVFDYVSKRITPPQYGIVGDKNSIEPILRYYAKELGLNQKETDDLARELPKNLTKHYALISYYPQDLSKKILPINFSPNPDTYINYVFYVKEYDTKPQFIPAFPTFMPIPSRGGTSAVEISWIIE